MGCQLKHLDTLRAEKHWIFDQFERCIQILHTVKRNISLVKYRIIIVSGLAKITYAHGRYKPAEIEEGSLVRIKSEKEIKKLLDPTGKYKGCLFIGRMFELCGKTFTVYKKVDSFYDEVKQRMCKCKGIVLLNGVTCKGDQKLYLENCDRACFYFCHVDWLEKVE